MHINDDNKDVITISIDDAYKKLKARRGTNLHDLGRLYRKASLKILSGDLLNEKSHLDRFQELQTAYNLLRNPSITKGLITDYRPAAQKRSDKVIEKREISSYLDKLSGLKRFDAVYQSIEHQQNQAGSIPEVSIEDEQPDREVCTDLSCEHTENLFESQSKADNDSQRSDRQIDICSGLSSSAVRLHSIDATDPITSIASTLVIDDDDEAKSPHIMCENKNQNENENVNVQTSPEQQAVSDNVLHKPQVSDAWWKKVLWASVQIAISKSRTSVSKKHVDKLIFDTFERTLKDQHNEPQRKCRIKGFLHFDNSHNGEWQITDLGFEVAKQLFLM